jgi:general secretion pathway protein D
MRRPTHSRHSQPLLAALLLTSCLWLTPLTADFALAEEDTVTLNFVNADIDSVTKAVAQITGKTFVLDPRVKGTVNVVSSRPVPQSLAYHFLLSALRMQGFAAVESNGVVRIMPEADAKTHGGPTQRGVSGDQLVTRVFPLRNENASSMVAVIRPLVAPNNPVTANPGSNSLLISDYADNLNRLEKIITALDVPYGAEPQIIPVLHTSAIDLANMLNRVYSSDSGNAAHAQQRVTIQADQRSNALIVRSDNPSKLSHVRALIASLDQPSANNGNIHVVYLKNAEAVKVAQTLRAIVSGEGNGATATSSTLSATQASLSTSTSTDGTVTGSANTASNPSSASSSGLQSGGFIQADASNNALIITAPEPVYNNLRQVIEMLDRRRAQVLVEALIVELTSDRASELGVQWLGGNVSSSKNTATFGGTNFGSGSRNLNGFVENLAKARSTGTLGMAPGLNLGIISDPAGLGVLIRALENDAKANILSTPNLLTLDNEEAKIVIGSNVPFISGQYAATGNSVTATPFQTYERKDVGLMLKVKPQISEGGLVRLQIYQEASSIQENTLSNVSGPSTNKRSIETSVVVDDGATIVIGGLIQDSAGSGQDKVPLLGDIPVVGSLFRYETRKRTKTNLMVFLRPQIVRDVAGYQKLTGDRYDYIIDEQKKAAAATPMMRNETAPPMLPKLSQTMEFAPAAKVTQATNSSETVQQAGE